MNNIFKQLLFTVAFIFCISMTASAQDGKKLPKKDPPVVVVEPKKDKPKEDKPRDNNNNNKGKKPQTFFLIQKMFSE